MAFIPITTIGAVMTASNAAAPAANLFDGNTVDYWYSGSGNLVPQWAQIQLAAAQEVVRYTITGYPGTVFSPTEWQLLGSNDAVTWTTLDARTGQNVMGVTSGWYDCALTGSFIYYRLNVTANGGNSVVVNELALEIDTQLIVGLSAAVSVSVDGLSGLGPMDLGDVALAASVATATSVDGWMIEIDLGTVILAAGPAVVEVQIGHRNLGAIAMNVGPAISLILPQPGTLANPYAATDSDSRTLDFASALFVATEPVALTGPPAAPSIWYEFTESQVADWLASTGGFANGADIELYSGPPGAGPGDLTFIATDGSVVLTLGAVTVTAMPATVLGVFQVESVDLGTVAVVASPANVMALS